MSDSKMRELVDRMAEMTPEPPPYPDQVPMSSPRPRRRDPILIFAGAAAVVLGVALLPVLLSGNGDDPAPAGSTPPRTDSTVGSNTTIPGSGPVALHDTVIYLVQNSSTGDDPALVAFTTQVVSGPELDIVEETLQMLANPGSLALPEGFEIVIPDEVDVVDVRRADGADNVLIIEMNDAFLDGAGGLLGDFTMLNQLIYTATATTPVLDGIDQVQFIVDNQQVTAFGTDGLDLSSSVGRADFRENLNSIIVTEPLIFGGDGLPQLEGVARVFEGTVSVDIVESESGEVVYTDFTTAVDFTTAECENGCWGSFVISFDTPELTPERTVLVYSESAEDGSRTDVVRIPVHPDGLWDFDPAG